MRALAVVVLILASGCYASRDESSTCPEVEAAWEEARELRGCGELPETLEACPLRCADLRFDVERSAGRAWRAEPDDLVRVFGAARDCDELADDAATVCR